MTAKLVDRSAAAAIALRAVCVAAVVMRMLSSWLR